LKESDLSIEMLELLAGGHAGVDTFDPTVVLAVRRCFLGRCDDASLLAGAFRLVWAVDEVRLEPVPRLAAIDAIRLVLEVDNVRLRSVFFTVMEALEVMIDGLALESPMAKPAPLDVGKMSCLGPSEERSPFDTEDSTGFGGFDKKRRMDACMLQDAHLMLLAACQVVASTSSKRKPT